MIVEILMKVCLVVEVIAVFVLVMVNITQMHKILWHKTAVMITSQCGTHMIDVSKVQIQMMVAVSMERLIMILV